jgi:hypothetical protein
VLEVPYLRWKIWFEIWEEEVVIVVLENEKMWNKDVG